ncbi:hypothetical protein [Microbulbifer sp.]|uniref:hypothetical protein n=1 Tax=Microbulbifer sp. TaxID=1908541 RepID=UPI0025864CA9|nr:hypothetical protein [Microbulbifer sp.]
MAEDLVVEADLRFIKDTGESSQSMCFEDEETTCFSWATFYLYSARVKKTISGPEVPREFRVIFGRHALAKKNISDVVIKLEELPENNVFNAMYQVVEIE